MSKLAKLIRHPGRYFVDAALNRQTNAKWRSRRENLGPGKPTALLVGFARWKTFILDYLPGYNAVVLSHTARLSTELIESISSYNQPHVFTWSYGAPADLALLCSRNGIPLTFVEDGFIRSVGLGADRSSPFSLVFDDQAMHFDRLRPSRLEAILASHDFDADRPLMKAAAELADRMVGQGLTKYMFASTRRVADLLRPGVRHVLVLGQVEDDLSIRYGAEAPLSGNALVLLAARENPGAQILYRPHPESLAYAKPHYSNPRLVADLCTVLGPEFGIADCIDNADLVYTVTSLAGFEAALRGKPVVTMGTPFYSGWGITQDRLPVARRTRRLTPLQVLAGAYLLYPRYAGIALESDSGKAEAVLASVARLSEAAPPGPGSGP
jgi:capsular polysaccharide export protein